MMPTVDPSPRDTPELTVESPPALVAFGDAADGFCDIDYCAMPARSLSADALSRDDER